MSDTTGARYFQLAYDHDQDANGNLPAAVHFGFTVAIPTLIAGQVGQKPEDVLLKPIPGTRIYQTTDPVHAEALLQSGSVVEVDKPSAKTLKEQRDSSTAYEAAVKARYAGLEPDDPEKNPDTANPEA